MTALSSGESYTYDANGNMTARLEGGLTYTQIFDAENRLISVTVSGQTTQFIYDGDGNLVKKIKPDGSKTLYVGGIYEVDKNSGGSVTGTTTYYPAAGAMRVGSTLYYMLKDHLGSASLVTTASGTTVPGADTRYYPFGEARFSTSSMITDKLFTGQRQIAELGIYHYGARFYSPKLGRFLSADTIVPSYANPQNLNRFSYVLNNPLKYIDPTGHRACEDGDGQGSCLSEKQVTKKYKAELHKHKHKKKSDGGGGGDHPLLSPSSNGDNGFYPCHQDPDCQPFSDEMRTATEIQGLNDGLSSYEDRALGIGIGAGILAVAAAFVPGVGAPLAIGLAVVSGLGFWEAHTANKLQSYLTDAKSIAEKQGNVNIIMSHRSDQLGGGSLVTVEYEGPDHSTPSGGQLLSPILSMILSMAP